MLFLDFQYLVARHDEQAFVPTAHRVAAGEISERRKHAQSLAEMKARKAQGIGRAAQLECGMLMPRQHILTCDVGRVVT